MDLDPWGNRIGAHRMAKTDSARKVMIHEDPTWNLIAGAQLHRGGYGEAEESETGIRTTKGQCELRGRIIAEGRKLTARSAVVLT